MADELEAVIRKGTLAALCESGSSISCNGHAEAAGDPGLL